MHLPEQYLDRLHRMLGEDYENYLASFDASYGQTLRVNRLKTGPADLIRRFSVDSVPWCENGFYYDGEERLSLHPYYYAGVYYLQEPSAMAPAQFLPVEPGDKVLDLCAAPGGKTTALAAKLQGQGLLLANDISASRCKALLKNMELAGVKNAIISCEEPERLAEHFPVYFDKILVDAPCSGEGMFRKEATMAASWSVEAVKQYAGIQKNILKQAVKMLKPGGLLMYSTCTYAAEEDEQSVEELLNQGFRLLELPLCQGVAEGRPDLSISGDPQLRFCRRFWSHRVKGEGQFAALLQKPMGPEELLSAIDPASDGSQSLEQAQEQVSLPAPVRRKKKNRRGSGRQGSGSSGGTDRKTDPAAGLPEELIHFLQEIDWQIDLSQIHLLEERAFLLPEGLERLRGIRQIRSGLYLGDCKKKRFEPSQALAMALQAQEYPHRLMLDLQDQRVERYLRGESFDAETEDGWVLVCVDSYPLGWGKAAAGRIKNKYYKGWRKN